MAFLYTCVGVPPAWGSPWTGLSPGQGCCPSLCWPTCGGVPPAWGSPWTGLSPGQGYCLHFHCYHLLNYRGSPAKEIFLFFCKILKCLNVHCCVIGHLVCLCFGKFWSVRKVHWYFAAFLIIFMISEIQTEDLFYSVYVHCKTAKIAFFNLGRTSNGNSFSLNIQMTIFSWKAIMLECSRWTSHTSTLLLHCKPPKSILNA
jgi:hypothetical protein